ncbi:MAG: radical SAM protein, partial [Myxococcales bacterium]|nr:radical SAM protein [Myxococcales bacterium]
PTPTPAACLPNTREIRVETSTACNYRCSMCPRESLTRPQQIMSDALFERVVRAARAEMPSLSMCTVSGFGDFCADPGWRNKLALARELFDEVHVVTNLARVDDDDIATLASLATEVRVSLYATTEETFRQVHKPPRGVRLCDIERRARALAARGGATLKMTCCELDANRDEIPTWITRWRHVAAHVEVWRPHNWVDGRAYREIAPAEQRLASCGRPAAGPIQVQVDGTINVCCFDYDGKMVVGDLSRQSLAEIFGGDALQRIRALHADGRADELDLCAVCDQRDPQQRRAEQLVYCSSADAAERVLRTSSGGETLRETRRA